MMMNGGCDHSSNVRYTKTCRSPSYRNKISPMSDTDWNDKYHLHWYAVCVIAGHV